MRYFLNLTLALFWFVQTIASESNINNTYLGSRENDPESIIENVSTIHSDYSDYEIDLIVSGPDSLILSRYYSSHDSLLASSSLGGWRFNPHCFLSIQKEALAKTYTTAEGRFDYTHILIGTNEGSILTYVGWRNTSNPDARSLFKVDVEGSLVGIANTAKGNVNARTNLKNNELYFDAKSNRFELFLSSGEKRVYTASTSNSDLYLLQAENLPSGNKIFYEYEGGALSQIKMTNASEEKVLSWIRIQYGPVIHIDTSDGKTVDYHFQQDLPLLSEAVRSDKPALKYQYRIVDDHPLLIKKDLPEGRFIQIDYYTNEENKNKVESIITPTWISSTTSTRFIYTNEEDGAGFTEVDGPLTQKAIYRFNDQLQLTAIEQYMDAELYRVHKKTWGKKQTAGNLIAQSVEDRNGEAYYYKSFAYDDRGNITEEKEYGNLTGASPEAIVLDEEGIPESKQESHAKTYSYRTVKDIDIVSQKDPKGSAVKLYYKKGTDRLIKKLLLEKKEIKKRWFYNYNDDGALIQVITDDGDEEDLDSAYDIRERHITSITPKQELPNVGAPEVIEEKYLDLKKGQEILLKKSVFAFDSQGNVKSIAVYDAKGEQRYTLNKTYEQGLLFLETDPHGNEARYTYDSNQNLASIDHSNSSPSFAYQYDLKNRLIYIGEKDGKGNCFETLYTYDDDFGFDRAFKAEMHGAMEHSLDQLHGMWNEGLVSAINFDPQSENAHFYENSAYAGLIALDVLRGNIKDIRKGMAFFSKPNNEILSLIAKKLGLRDGLKVRTNEALKLAEQYLGSNYRSIGKGRFVSSDGRRQVRMGDSDILGKHGGGPHMNFEVLQPSLHKEGKMEIVENYHIFIED